MAFQGGSLGSRYYTYKWPPVLISRTKIFQYHAMQMLPTPGALPYETPSMPPKNKRNVDQPGTGPLNRKQHHSPKAPPNGVLSLRSATNSSTLFKYRPSSPCFSSVLLTISLSLSALFLPVSTLLNAPASLLGLRCNMAGTELVALAEGIEGVSGMR